MSTIGAYEAQPHFAELLNRTERGETIVIARQGKPIAKLIPVEDVRRGEIDNALPLEIEGWLFDTAEAGGRCAH